MIKIGDKVKFDSYLNKNYMTGKPFAYSIGKKRVDRRTCIIDRGIDITKYKERILTESEPIEGIFVGNFKKKLIRSYRREEPKPITFSGRHDGIGIRLEEAMPIPIFHDYDAILHQRIRPSKNPRRLDDPRQLNDMAMIKYGRKLIGVPMTNIYKCNYGKLLNVI